MPSEAPRDEATLLVSCPDRRGIVATLAQVLYGHGANILDAEGFRQAEILKAEGEKQAQILAAEGRREAAFRDAEAREREAEAEAKATRFVSDAVASGNINALNYFVAQKYVDALGRFAESENQKILFLPLEASNVIGAVGGIAEIARDAMTERAQQRPGGPWATPPGNDRS